MKLCIDCRFYKARGAYLGTPDCAHSAATHRVPAGINPVHGGAIKAAEWQDSCESMRRSGACGPHGSLFQSATLTQ